MIAHDPSRSGSPVPNYAARFSQSEIQAVCTKAARGAGLTWGMAEEAGFAARRLSEAGLPGPELLLRYLEAPPGVTPRLVGRIWMAPKGRQCCPLATGTALSDRARLIDWQESDPIEIRCIAYPALVLAFIQTISDVQNQALQVSWRQFEAIVTPGGIRCDTDNRAHNLPEAGLVTVSLAKHMPPAQARDTGRSVALDIWRKLDRLAQRTTVPATDTSRADAGARSSDND